MDEMKIRYIKDDDGFIYGAVVESTNGKHSARYIAPAYGGLWVEGMQTIGHADFHLTGTNSNRRRQLRRAIMIDASYEAWIMFDEMAKEV